jgi:hypothetical protein
MKSYCLSFVPRIGYLKKRVTQRYVVFRQRKVVADVLQCKDDDENGSYYFLFFSEEEAKAIATIRAKYGQRELAMCTLDVQQARAHTTFGLSTWNLSGHNSMGPR